MFKRIKISITAIAGCVTLLNATSLAASTAPTISPSGEKAELIDTSGKTIDITASGGDCDEPGYSCQWSKDGGLVYEWTYTGVQGSPASGGEGTALKLKRDQAGSSDVTVKAKQKWKDSAGNNDTTTSAKSTAVKVKIQKPTSIAFVSSSKNSDGSGGAFKFKVQDQDSAPIKNANLTLTETISGTVTYRDLAGNELAVVPIGQASGVASSAGTNGNGEIVDTPVGVTVASLTNIAKNVAKKSVTATFTVQHKYDDIVTADGKKYPITITQSQTIVQKAILNDNETVTVSTESVNP